MRTSTWYGTAAIETSTRNPALTLTARKRPQNIIAANEAATAPNAIQVAGTLMKPDEGDVDAMVVDKNTVEDPDDSANFEFVPDGQKVRAICAVFSCTEFVCP